MKDVGFGNPNSYSNAYFDSTFGKQGIREDVVYAGGVDLKSYEDSSKIVKSSNKYVGDMLVKERGTATSEYASGTSFSSTSGSLPSLIPIWMSPDIINLSRKMTPVYELLPKQAVRGKFYVWNKKTYATTNAAFKPEGAPMLDYDDTVSTSVIPMKYCYAIGRVTGPMQVAGRGYLDAERTEIMDKSQALLQKLENEIINGNTSTDSNGFNGLLASISTNSTTLSDVISVSALRTSVMHARQGAESYSAVLGGGNPDLIITDLQTLDDLKALLAPYLRYPDVSGKIGWGITTITFEQIPIIASRFMTTTTTSKSVIVIDTSKVRLGVSLDITFERLAKTDDSNKFYLKWYGALLVLAETHCSKIITIT